jgi:predicted oxidoreductase
MKTQRIAQTPFVVSRIVYGCLGLGGSWKVEPLAAETRQSALRAVRAALEQGINYFDHANIYACGKSEEAFGDIWQERPGLRHQIVLQSKAGIRMPNDPEGGPGRYDFRGEYILRCVEGSLKRLRTDYLDLLLLHRPDPLMEPAEVAEALAKLQASGKVRFFGVSNQMPWHIELLQHYVQVPLVVNQLELNIVHNHLINSGVSTNQDEPSWPVRGEGTLEYCRLHDITIQAWSPLARGALSGKPLEGADARVVRAAEVVAEIARERGVSREAIVIAWLLRHPAQIQPVLGTTQPGRIAAACQADAVDLTREEWYRLFIAGRGAPMP